MQARLFEVTQISAAGGVRRAHGVQKHIEFGFEMT